MYEGLNGFCAVTRVSVAELRNGLMGCSVDRENVKMSADTARQQRQQIIMSLMSNTLAIQPEPAISPILRSARLVDIDRRRTIRLSFRLEIITLHPEPTQHGVSPFLHLRHHGLHFRFSCLFDATGDN